MEKERGCNKWTGDYNLSRQAPLLATNPPPERFSPKSCKTTLLLFSQIGNSTLFCNKRSRIYIQLRPFISLFENLGLEMELETLLMYPNYTQGEGELELSNPLISVFDG